MECFNHFILILWQKNAFHSNFSILFFYQLHNYKMDNNLHFILLGCKVDNKAIIGIIARFYKFMSQSQSRFSKMVHIILQFLICSPSFTVNYPLITAGMCQSWSQHIPDTCDVVPVYGLIICLQPIFVVNSGPGQYLNDD